jgi:hypothetical protein
LDTIVSIDAPAFSGDEATAVATVMNSQYIEDDNLGNIWTTTNPEENLVQNYYLSQVEEMGLEPIPGGKINLSLSENSGPLYIDGDAIFVTDDYNTVTTKLVADSGEDRIIFVNGEVQFDQKCNLNLNGYTIFAASFDPLDAIWTDTQCDIGGPGALIANGGINFQPQLNNTEYLYVMSLAGDITMKPGDSFVGSIAGDLTVQLQPGVTITWADPTGLELNLPGDEDHELLLAGIATWIIN